MLFPIISQVPKTVTNYSTSGSEGAPPPELHLPAGVPDTKARPFSQTCADNESVADCSNRVMVSTWNIVNDPDAVNKGMLTQQPPIVPPAAVTPAAPAPAPVNPSAPVAVTPPDPNVDNNNEIVEPPAPGDVPAAAAADPGAAPHLTPAAAGGDNSP